MNTRTQPVQSILDLSDSGVWAADDPVGGVSILRSTNFGEGGEIDYSNLAIKAVPERDRVRKALRPGDILIEKSGGGPKQPVGRVAYFRAADQAHVFGNFIARLRTKPDLCDSRYLFWFLFRAHENGLTEAFQKQTTGIRNLELKRYLDVGIPLPQLEEQRRIVRLLDRAAEIRRRADAARAKARAIIPALFLDMFGDPATNWPEITLEDVLVKQPNAIRTGPFGSQLKHSEFTEEGVPVLGIDNVVDNEFKWAKPRHLPREKYELFKRFRVFPGDVIVTIMGTTGRVAVAPDTLPECMSTKHLCAFTVDRSLAHARFVQGALLFDPRVRTQARGKANGQIMEGWNMGIVRSMRLRLPPLPLQAAFAEQAQRLEAAARALDAAAAKADAMAAALSAEVFDTSRSISSPAPLQRKTAREIALSDA